MKIILRDALNESDPMRIRWWLEASQEIFLGEIREGSTSIFITNRRIFQSSIPSMNLVTENLNIVGALMGGFVGGFFGALVASYALDPQKNHINWVLDVDNKKFQKIEERKIFEIDKGKINKIEFKRSFVSPHMIIYPIQGEETRFNLEYPKNFEVLLKILQKCYSTKVIGS